MDLHHRRHQLRHRGRAQRGAAVGSDGRFRAGGLRRARCGAVRHHLGAAQPYDRRTHRAALPDAAHGADVGPRAEHRATRLGAQIRAAQGCLEPRAGLGAARRPRPGAHRPAGPPDAGAGADARGGHGVPGRPHRRGRDRGPGRDRHGAQGGGVRDPAPRQGLHHRGRSGE